MGLSSIAFVATGLLGFNQQTQQAKQLSSPVVEGEVDTLTESTYIQNGFTWVKYYYEQPDQNFLFYIQSLPQVYALPSGQTQLIVQKINTKYLNESSYVIITSPQGQESFQPDIRRIAEAMCKLLTVTPFECLLKNINQNTTQSNETEANITENNTGNKTE